MSRCPQCGLRTADGCTNHVASSTAFTKGGVGSQASPFTLTSILDANVNNLLTLVADGHLAQLPATILNPPYCEVFKFSGQSIPNNVMTVVTFNAEAYDTDNMHSLTSNTGRITFNTAGTYNIVFYGLFYFNTVATGDRIAQIRKNGDNAQILSYESKKGGSIDLYVGHTIEVQDTFIVGDYVEAMVQQTSGGALTLVAEYGSPLFVAAMI